MKKRIIAMVLVAVLVAGGLGSFAYAQEGSVTMQGSGTWPDMQPEGVDGKVALYINTETGIVQARAIIPGGVIRDEQFVTQGYWEAEVTGWDIDGGIVTVDIEGQAFWLPSRELAGDQPEEVWVVGEPKGPGNRGDISFWVVPVAGAQPMRVFIIPGTIIIR